MGVWFAKSVNVIVVKVSKEGPVGPYNAYEFYLKNGRKIGEISEIGMRAPLSPEFSAWDESMDGAWEDDANKE